MSDETTIRVERQYRNEVAEHGKAALVGSWIVPASYDEWRELVAERDRLREALDFYASNSTYIEGLPPQGSFDGPTPIHLDSGRRARAALSATGPTGGET